MKYLDKLEIIKDKDSENPEYKEMINEMKRDVISFYSNFSDDYKNMSEWGHGYFCEEDGGKLEFDLNLPHSHKCSICGKDYTGQHYDNIWTYFYRNEAILTLWKAAILYKVRGDEEYLNIFKYILNFYADNYDEFVLHAKGSVVDDITVDIGGAGKIMPQGLNEAIITVRIINALEILKEDLDKEYLDSINEKFFKKLVVLFKPQVCRIQNIACWINSALGLIGLFTKDKELVDFVFNSEFGINNQLKKGVTDSGFWYEGSIHYNFFVLEGVTNLLLFTKIYEEDFEIGEEKVRHMLKAAYEYAFDNLILPNPNDGWPNLSLKTYSYIYHIATKIYGEDSDIGNLLKNIDNGKIKRTYLPLSKPYYYGDICLENLIFNPDINLNNYTKIKCKSKNFETSYYGILRKNDVNVFLKYGHVGPSHAHPDKMNVEIMLGNETLTRDLSNSGYGSKLCNEWHRMAVSHNTVVVNGKNHTSFEKGYMLDFKENSMLTLVKNVYDKVDFIREITISDASILDKFIVTSENENNYDYLFHCEAELLTKLELEDYTFQFKTNGYQHIKNPRKVITQDEKIILTWKLNNYTLNSEINLKNKELIIADTYDNPVIKFRKSIILKSHAKNDMFEILWNFKAN